MKKVAYRYVEYPMLIIGDLNIRLYLMNLDCGRLVTGNFKVSIRLRIDIVIVRDSYLCNSAKFNDFVMLH